MKLTINGAPDMLKTILVGAVAFAALWYFYFSSSFVLRPYQYVFWIGMAGLSLATWIIANRRVLKVDLWFIGGMVVIWLLSIFGTDMYGSLIVLANYLIYYLVARMIADQNSSRTILNMILAFSLVHMVCIYIQVFATDVYKAVLLPLLPSDTHTEILEQMEYNEAYYGFAVQTGMSAMYLSVGAVLCAVRMTCTEKKATKVLYAVLVALLSVAMFFTVRRGSTVALILILMLMFFLSKGKASVKMAVAVGLVLLVVIAGVERIPGLQGILNKFEVQADKNLLMSGRENTFVRSLSLFLERPFFGFGLGQIDTALGYAWLENSYLVILVECGLLGAMLYFVPYGIMLKNTWTNFWKKYRKNACVAFSFYVQILFVIMSMVENYLAAPATLFLLFTVVFAGNKAIKEEQCAKDVG